MEDLMLDVLYELPSMREKRKALTITTDFVDHKISVSELLTEGREVA